MSALYELVDDQEWQVVIAYLCIHNSPLEDNLFVKLYHHEQGIIRDSVLTYI